MKATRWLHVHSLACFPPKRNLSFTTQNLPTFPAKTFVPNTLRVQLGGPSPELMVVAGGNPRFACHSPQAQEHFPISWLWGAMGPCVMG